MLDQELRRENSSATEKDRLEYVKSHLRGSKIYHFSCSATQIFLCPATMVADISEDFEHFEYINIYYVKDILLTFQKSI